MAEIHRAFPAHAGMNRYRHNGTYQTGSVPRTRGDEPHDAHDEKKLYARSPHTRG